MKEHDGMGFGSKGPEDGKEDSGSANSLNGAKGGGMKHVVSPGADDMERKKHMMAIAMMRAMAGGGAPMGAAPPPMGGPPMGGGMPMGGGGY